MSERAATSGYLIEKTFAHACRKSQTSPGLSQSTFSNRPAQYRGLQREPLLGWSEALRGSGVVEPTDQELEACLFLEGLNHTGKAEDDVICALEDARRVLAKLKTPVEWEIVWARCMDMDVPDSPPAGTVLLGYEPGEFYPPTCLSPIANSLFFTEFAELRLSREQDLQLKEHYDKLNEWGLFDTQAEAEEYLKAFFTLLPDEQRYAHYMIEVRAIAD
ncbi:MAG TPA: hypothetical protein VLI39_03260 [Sedimentisphaerales bacterium]|nr:hypothetical protein [Sedimentisphaerales bacterium]